MLQQEKTPQRRILVVLSLFLAIFFVLIGRLAQLQLVEHEKYVKEAGRRQVGRFPVMPKRGNIYDRNRRELVVSNLQPTLYCDTARLSDEKLKTAAAAHLAPVLAVPAQTIYRKLHIGGHPRIERGMNNRLAERVKMAVESSDLPAGAFYLQDESKRHHPKGSLACHVLGFTRPDNTGDNLGQAGLEEQYDAVIRGNYQKYRALRDALSTRLIPLDKKYYSAAFGHELILTIDESIQHIAEKALHEAVAQYRAKSGVVIVQLCKTGEILALASVPDFDANRYYEATAEQRKNRAVTDAFNMGSVMKIFSAAALIETGAIASLDQWIDCHNGWHVFPPRRSPIRDDHPMGVVPFREVFRESSNIGMVEACRNLSPFELSRILRGFGFGERTGIDLPYEATGILRPLDQWTDYSMLALPYGAEITVTPIQLATAVSAIANKGMLMKPHLVKEIRTYEGAPVEKIEPEAVRRVVSKVTAEKVLGLMEEVVGCYLEDGTWVEGTGKNARIPNYRVGGKTGTFKYIEQIHDRPTSFTASFVAVLPLPDPELTVFCVIDQPRGNKYGGTVAAPVVRRVAEDALRILGIPARETDRTSPDIEIALHRMRSESPTVSVHTPRGVMPDLRGKTMLEAAGKLAGLDLRMTYEGSGVVVAQSPPPGQSLVGQHDCILQFGDPNSSAGQ